MPRHNHHEKPYDEGTLEKLELFQDYVREWLPVFFHSSFVDNIQIFDFFAGPGRDLDGVPGSPLIICEEIRSALNVTKYPSSKIKMYLNEFDREKYDQLLRAISPYRNELSRVDFSLSNEAFLDIFSKWQPLMQGNANLLFFDQNGFQQITPSIFQAIVQLPYTDFIFFISSSMINRFKNETRDYVPVNDEDFSLMNGTNVHRIVTNAYNRLVPPVLDYYLGPFSIKKGPNVYGLIFGSGHPLGIDKFLHVAWKHGGDANFDIDNDRIDPVQPFLFSEFNKRSKIAIFEKELESAILKKEISTNKDVYIFSLKNGVLPNHAKAAIEQMIRKNIIPEQKLNISYDAWKKREYKQIKLY